MLTSVRGRLSSHWLSALVLAVIVGFGAWTRASGFSHGTPWFDDAWVVLSSKVGFGTAFHMVNTTPLFSLGMRSWILLKPDTLWWAQLPIFVLGLGTIVAVFLLLRYFRTWWPLPFLGALIIAVSPVAVDYSTRIKQYNLDILLACTVLWLFERWRRDRSRRGAIQLSVACGLALLISAMTIVVIAPICAVILHAMYVDKSRRGDGVVTLLTVAVVGLVEYVVWLRHLSHGLDVGWTNRGYMLSLKSHAKFKFSLENMLTELFHWMIGVPTGHPPDPSKIITSAGIAIAVTTALLLAVVTLAPLIDLARHLRKLAGPLVAPAIAVVFAGFLGLAGISPFGGGRTDEVFYPALLLLFAGFVTSVATQKRESLTRVLLVGCVVAAAGCVVVGTRNRAEYPTIGLRALYAKFSPHVGPNEFVVVDPWLTFGWADEGFTATSVSFEHTFFDWSQGFHVLSDNPHVIISDQYFFPSAEFGGLNSYSHILWYVGETGGPTWPLARPTDPLYVTRNYEALLRAGWYPTSTTYRATHTIAILMRWKPPTTKPPSAVTTPSSP